jgi:hypothetical protein
MYVFLTILDIKRIICLIQINLLIFVMVKCVFLFEVRTEFLIII